MHLHAACPHAIPNNRPRRKHFGALRDCVFCVQLHVMRKRTYHPLERKNLGHFAQDTPCATIHNLVGTTSLHCSTGDIDLDHIHAMLPNTFYDKSRFAAITIRIFNPSTTALLFTSGKLVLTGAVSWLECLLASLHIARILSRVCPGSRFCVVDTQVQNIVGNAVVPLERHQMLDLRALYADHSTIATWQPSMFPGRLAALLLRTSCYHGWANRTRHSRRLGHAVAARKTVCAKRTRNAFVLHPTKTQAGKFKR